MNAFGIITLNMEHESIYFYEIAKRAYTLDMTCFRFLPSSICPLTEMVTGDQFNPTTMSWEECKFPLPDILYDRCFYGEDSASKRCMAIMKWLKTRKDLHFLGIGLPNKLALYQALATSELSPYLLPSKPILSGESLIQELVPLKPVMIKPVNGSQGRGIYYLKKQQNEVIVQTDKQEKQIMRTFKNEQSAENWLNQLLQDHTYLVQAYEELRNNEDCPFDIRILLQKDENGQWSEVVRGVRYGQKGGIISNLSAGGEISSFQLWIQALPLEKRQFIHNEIDEIIVTLPKILEQHFPPLFEIGLDIGMNKDGALWVLDINSKPGRKVALALHPEKSDQLYAAPLQYGKRLLQMERSYQP
ncbi:glutathione synthase/RimK-type ligase-like ATP-grasp enzyme [Cytobacillus eiseniae]|uniref:Glutathione synthase/RimK-type ligase-like ATP-grasp enzyme n=1 Tax=Cytobacillus eiseniae TaxID=762947 RepID=A0ABS4RGU3_9BACI|nr:YheC/YheD family protein [Cytobacillus eiseniae]MBP2241052.1 glutathione synthase/RimK-type ligase-like ATP-grasp enzyme [Cytobacillus eiseniae]